MRCKAIASALLLLLFALTLSVVPASAETSPALLEQSMSDILDLWRDGRYEQMYGHLSRRGKTSKEQFIKKMQDTSIRPACCFKKLENFKVLNEKRTEATVYAKVGLEGPSGTAESSTREFKLTHEENLWKMQLSDVISISGASGKKARHSSHRKKSSTK